MQPLPVVMSNLPLCELEQYRGCRQGAGGRRGLRAAWGQGWLGSLILHALAIGLLGVLGIPSWWLSSPVSVLQVSWSDPRSGPAESSSVDAAETASTPAIAVRSSDSEVARENFRAQVEAAVKTAEASTADDRLNELDALAERMEQVSSAKTLGQLSTRIHDWLGLQPRATAPRIEPASELAGTSAETPSIAAPTPAALPKTGEPLSADGKAESENRLATKADSPRDPLLEFDFQTAQLHDVKRIPATDPRSGSTWQYEGVLLDAEGRTQQIPLSETEGAPLFEIWQRIRSSPLLESVYRQLAMPLLDQLIDAKQLSQRLPPSPPTSPPATPAEPASEPESATDRNPIEQ